LSREILPWKIVRTEPCADYRIFKVRKDITVSPRTAQAHDMFIIESADYVNIIPLTPQNEVVLVEQFRHGTKEIALETPGGLAELAGESHLECARRELLEETGYAAAELLTIGEVRPNPAVQSNRMFYVLARDCRKVAEPAPDHAEDIAVHLVPLTEIPRLIRGRRISHALVVTAFYFLNEYLRQSQSTT
jgi:8-oxo-dGTP pyrophosphatase MutT (NUDIX family)